MQKNTKFDKIYFFYINIKLEKKGKKVKKLIIGFTAIFSTLTFADENYQYEHICLNNICKAELIMEEDGYNIYILDGKEYIHLVRGWSVPRHSCRNNQVVLFLKPEEDDT